MLYMVTFTINIPPMLVYIYIHHTWILWVLQYFTQSLFVHWSKTEALTPPRVACLPLLGVYLGSCWCHWTAALVFFDVGEMSLKNEDTGDYG